ncbi:MAG: spermidine synthase family protein [Coriobacteriia bacterium]
MGAQGNGTSAAAHNGRDIRPVLSLLLLMVFTAGAASLLYEVVWVRQLGMSLGSTALASSVMLSAFLGGLAIGSWIAGRRADSLASPLMTLVRIELAAAAIGAISVPALERAGHAYVLVSQQTGADPQTSLLLRAAFAFVVMLLPAIAFGMTFPVATAAAARLVAVERASGWISAASSFGSAVGAAATGLYLEPALGLTGSAWTGAALNVIAAICVLIASRLLGSSEAA